MCSKLNKDKKITIACIGRDKMTICRLIFVLIFCMAILAGCGVPDRALVLTGDGAAESAVQDSVGSGAAGSVTQGSAGSGAAESAVQDGAGSGAAENGTQNSTGNAETQTILVYVCGAVANPGVVELPADSRAADALEAAGGLLASAQPDYVNLAARLEDAQKLYFPTSEEAEELVQKEAAAARGLVNINTADVEELCTLPGIGEARAQDIIAYREQHGAFQSGEDIMKVSGIKQNAYEKMKDQITVK